MLEAVLSQENPRAIAVSNEKEASMSQGGSALTPRNPSTCSELDLSSGAIFSLLHGWATVPLLLQLVATGALRRLRSSSVPLAAADLAIALELADGPLDIALRACVVLGYLDFDATEGKYSVVSAAPLAEIEAILGDGSVTAEAFRSLYHYAVPPFPLASAETVMCLRVWREHRKAMGGSISSSSQVGGTLVPESTCAAATAVQEGSVMMGAEDLHARHTAAAAVVAPVQFFPLAAGVVLVPLLTSLGYYFTVDRCLRHRRDDDTDDELPCRFVPMSSPQVQHDPVWRKEHGVSRRCEPCICAACADRQGSKRKIEALDCRSLDATSRSALGELLEAFGVGTLDVCGRVAITPRGALALQRARAAYCKPTAFTWLLASYGRLLSASNTVCAHIFGHVRSGEHHGTCLGDSHGDKDGEHNQGSGDNRSAALYIASCESRRRTLLRDLLTYHVGPVFAGEDFASQPTFVVLSASLDIRLTLGRVAAASFVTTTSATTADEFAAASAVTAATACAAIDADVIRRVYRHVRRRTSRGKALDQFPLTMVGVVMDELSRKELEARLDVAGIPRCVVLLPPNQETRSRSACPEKFVKVLREAGVDPAATLHLRPHLSLSSDNYVVRSKPGASLQEWASASLEPWGRALAGSFGLCCVMEAPPMDVGASRRSLRGTASFTHDLVGSLVQASAMSTDAPAIRPGASRSAAPILFPTQTPPAGKGAAAITLGAAMAGLLPSFDGHGRAGDAGAADITQTYSESSGSCRGVGLRLVPRPFRIRLAEETDVPKLVELEALAWKDPNLRASPDVLLARLRTSPAGVLVVTVSDRGVVAVLYTQRIEDADGCIDRQTFDDAHEAASRDGGGRFVQLMAIGVDPASPVLGVGSELRTFALHLARMDTSVERVVAVTRCAGFRDAVACQDMPYSGVARLQAYVDAHVGGRVRDPVIGFHTGHGARVRRVVPGYRPKDVDNHGCGVLIEYDLGRSRNKQLTS
eukprot:TRINITY_DN48442_c0_g1_i1.p1 TRINITY_DN48442_c0_g1~~TRINITY_DN48442_c0_g1_i1.p1  ORF type:complete len:1000 (-),score=145.76 TRINITY_DN48442_c0_g1_i1:338-3292(-)